MKYLYTLICSFILTMFLMASIGHTSDAYVRGKVVKLISANGEGYCTGEHIQSPSGKTFILSANHCVSPEDRTVTVETDDKRHIQREIIARDPAHDLLLIQALDLSRGLKIADSIDAHEHLRAFIHGAALDTYKIEGEYIQDMAFPILGMPNLMATTLPIIPGASGGAAVNAYDEVVGVADILDTRNNIGYFVSLRYIRNFLMNF